jgi:hypothetical protein
MKKMSRTLSLSVSLILSAAALVGCTTADEAKCNDTITSWCAKVASCGQTSKDSCETTLKKEINCDNVAEIPKDYDKCAGQIEALKCPITQGSFPNSCNIKTRS